MGEVTLDHRDAIAKVIDPKAWEMADIPGIRERNDGKVFELLVKESRETADRIIKSGLMTAFEWDRQEYQKALDKIKGNTSRTGRCYGVEDGLDGYCLHDVKCVYWPSTSTGPNSDCIK